MATTKAHTLILGSMPGIKSLEQQQYYAHPQNAFWKIMRAALDFDENESYKNRLKILKQHNLALWDVLQQCEREGSLDQKIKKESEEPNDFDDFFKSHPKIKTVLLNGKKASQLFHKIIKQQKPLWALDLKLITLPSTSPAHAGMNLIQKKKTWLNALSLAKAQANTEQHHVYLIETQQGTLYTGYTNNLFKRMLQHKEGKGAKYMRAFGFKKLVYKESFVEKSSALKREAEIKKFSLPQKKILISKGLSHEF